MSVPAPHFLLFSQSRRQANQESKTGKWHFVLESLDGSAKLEAADEEPEVQGERLELLAVVRGLEALDQPSRVTLVTPSQYVSRGIRNGLAAWRESNWQWERFGKMAPVKNHDLWQRIDQALQYHSVDCRTWRFDAPASSSAETTEVTGTPADKLTVGDDEQATNPRTSQRRAGLGQYVRHAFAGLRQRVARSNSAV